MSITNNSYKEEVLVALKENGLLLRKVSALLQDDREVVLTAIASDGRALKFLASVTHAFVTKI